jgi:hypothetical protein
MQTAILPDSIRTRTTRRTALGTNVNHINSAGAVVGVYSDSSPASLQKPFTVKSLAPKIREVLGNAAAAAGATGD